MSFVTPLGGSGHGFPDGLCPHLDRFKYRTYRKGKVYLGFIYVLCALMEQFPKTRFRLFHIPEKVEVHEGKYSVNLAEDLVPLNIEYIPLLNACGWRDDMFHKYDRIRTIAVMRISRNVW